MAVGLALLTAGCGTSEPDTANRADTDAGDEPTVVLRLARTAGLISPYEGDLRAALAEHSGGTVTTEIATEWNIVGTAADVEQQIISAVIAGEVDLGWIGSRAFTERGITSFDALTAPMLVDSYDLQAAILDSDIPARMLDGLDELGLTGLGITAGMLRRPAASAGPLLGPDDYDGITFHVARSEIGRATLAALGATVVAFAARERDSGFEDGSIAGYENTMYHLDGYLTLLNPHITTNVAFWPATGVLIANPDTLAGLTDDQVRWLRAAATDTAAQSVARSDVDADILARLCPRGAQPVEATDDQVAQLREAVEPVYTQLAEDDQTAEFIAEIEMLKGSVTAEPLTIPDECSAN